MTAHIVDFRAYWAVRPLPAHIARRRHNARVALLAALGLGEVPPLPPKAPLLKGPWAAATSLPGGREQRRPGFRSRPGRRRAA